MDNEHQDAEKLAEELGDVMEAHMRRIIAEHSDEVDGIVVCLVTSGGHSLVGSLSRQSGFGIAAEKIAIALQEGIGAGAKGSYLVRDDSIKLSDIKKEQS